MKNNLTFGAIFAGAFVGLAALFNHSAPKPVVQPTPVISSPAISALDLQALKTIADSAACSAHSWQNRGTAPSAYLEGMALAFAREYCKLNAGDAVAKLAAEANTGDDAHDAISWYNSNFKNISMVNVGGVDTLRHLFVLAISHGMQESSGKYCTGHDMSAGIELATEAEAGLFQTSANAVGSSSLIPGVLSFYASHPANCLLDVFQKNVSCPAHDAVNVGSGSGAQFQQLLKSCPAAAVEVDLITLRVLRKHYGPINRKEAELYAPCDTMLSQIQKAVDSNSSLCGEL